MKIQEKLTAEFSELDRVTPRPLSHEDYAIAAIQFFKSDQSDELSKAQERVKELEDLLDDLLRNYELGKLVDDQILAVLDPKRPQS